MKQFIPRERKLNIVAKQRKEQETKLFKERYSGTNLVPLEKSEYSLPKVSISTRNLSKVDDRKGGSWR